MRLTSYNMAVKILHAKGCLADMVDRMWAYMEEGDTENAQCVREKALGLYSLIETAGRWRPTIRNGRYFESFGDLRPIFIPEPYILGNVRLNGLIVTPEFTSYGGVTKFVDGLVNSTNCNISQDDDLVQLSLIKVGNLGVHQSIRTSFDALSPSRDESSGGGTGTEAVTAIDSGEFSDAQPHCLTDAQILSVVGKIDELCDCKC